MINAMSKLLSIGLILLTSCMTLIEDENDCICKFIKSISTKDTKSFEEVVIRDSLTNNLHFDISKSNHIEEYYFFNYSPLKITQKNFKKSKEIFTCDEVVIERQNSKYNYKVKFRGNVIFIKLTLLGDESFKIVSAMPE